MNELETEPDCPRCGAEGVPLARTGEVIVTRHCPECKNRWNPNGTVVDEGHIPDALIRLIAFMSAVTLGMFIAALAAVTWFVQRGERPSDVPPEQWDAFVADPMGVIAPLMVEKFLTLITDPLSLAILLWVTIPITPILAGLFLYAKRNAIRERLETDGDGEGS